MFRRRGNTITIVSGNEERLRKVVREELHEFFNTCVIVDCQNEWSEEHFGILLCSEHAKKYAIIDTEVILPESEVK